MFPGSGQNSYQNVNYGSYGPPPGPPPQNSSVYGESRQYNRPPASMQTYSNSGNSLSPHYNAPPSAPQSFGQNTDFSFQYSNCSGRRKALLVGINYFGTNNELRGCINDIKNMSSFLISRFGYTYADMVILSDDQQDYSRLPTRDNILRAMQWLVRDAQPNDSLVFHYSGHGGVTKDLDGDEESGFDDCIYPLDFEQCGNIIDDIMHDIMVRPLPPGCRLTALFDSCHSGTALDLPYVYSTKGVVKQPNMLKDAGKGAFNAFMDYERGDLFGAVSSLSGMVNKFTGSGSIGRDKIIAMKASPADVISISGCKDDQTSADATENGMNTGAMSWSFIKVLSEQPQQSYLSLLNNMRGVLSGKYSQKPQLSSSHPTDMNLLFIM